jgi:predicted 2-oxoglutarate/Fe(II)-dependent dioxygenase YbiX
MTVQIVSSYIPSNLCDLVLEELDSYCTKEPRMGMWSAFGQRNSLIASKISASNPITELVNDEKTNKAILFLSALVVNVKEEMQKYYSIDLDLVNVSFSRIEEGGYNPLHSDSTKNDGSPWRDDGKPEEVEYSALVYFSNYGEDFLGGEIVFPQHELTVFPEKGMLVFFKGDEKHLHSVEPITFGKRHTLVLFFGKKGNVSEEPFFAD